MNNFSGTLIDGLQTLRESRIENRKMEDITKIRHVLAADCSPMNVGNDLDSPLSSKSDSDQEHSVLQSSTPTRQVRTYSISFKVRTLKLSLYFPAKCMVWLPVVIGSLQKVPKAFIFHCPKHRIVFFLRGCPMHTLGRKTAKGCSKDNAKMLHRSF